jgi:CheY-like chemotaxis protein
MGSVLIIDDEQAVRGMLDTALRLSGFQVTTAADGREGLEKFFQGRFDLVVTDVCLPDADGREVLDRIRTSDRGQTPVIGVSGTPWLLERSGFDRVLAKPFRLQRLLESVFALLPSTAAIH